MFKNNIMKANPGKYHLLVNSKDGIHPVKVDSTAITDQKCEKLLSITNDRELDFTENFQSLCKTTSTKK